MSCEHGYVPVHFGTGITVPVVKDRLEDLSCAVLIIGLITLSHIISKIFEYCILHKYEHLLQSDDLQLEFKKKFWLFTYYICVNCNYRTFYYAW